MERVSFFKQANNKKSKSHHPGTSTIPTARSSNYIRRLGLNISLLAKLSYQRYCESFSFLFILHIEYVLFLCHLLKSCCSIFLYLFIMKLTWPNMQLFQKLLLATSLLMFLQTKMGQKKEFHLNWFLCVRKSQKSCKGNRSRYKRD